MTGDDRRSVGELLLEADHVARDVLMDVPGMDAATMLRSWGEVVQAAGELWQALPSTTPPRPGAGRPVADVTDVTMQRLQAMTGSYHRRHGAGWPGQGPPDERHLQIAASFARATDLITCYQSPQPPLNAPEAADVNAARTRVIHTLYIASHGVNVALTRHLRELETKLATRGRLPTGESLRQTRTAQQHITTFEQLAGSIVATTYPHALAGEHHDRPSTGRLAQALADWDITSHRVLAGSTHTADLMLAARTQALILTGSTSLLHAAVAAGHLDHAHHVRLDPAIVTSQTRWETLAGMWAGFTAPSDRRTEPVLGGASLEVRAALRELLHDGATTSRPAVIAQRTDISRVPALVRQVLAANLDLSHTVEDIANDDRLAGAARGVNAIATAARGQDPSNADAINESPRAATVTPQDLLANRAVPLPHSVRTQLVADAAELTAAATTAMSEGTQLGSRAPKLHRYGEPSSGVGRVMQDRTPAVPPLDRPGARCER
ncbi:MAG: hypothetical protein ACRC35_00915 [Angustibacter sp.]